MRGWLTSRSRALREDMAATRAPLPDALALAHRLSRSDDGLPGAEREQKSDLIVLPDRRDPTADRGNGCDALRDVV